MGIPVIPFLMHSFLSIPGTIPATNQEWHHSARIFIPRNVILAGLWANFDSSGFRRNDRNPAGISGAWLRPPGEVTMEYIHIFRQGHLQMLQQ